MKNIKKSDVATFNKQAYEFFLSAGLAYRPFPSAGRHEFIGKTIFGPISIKFFANEDSSIYSVYSCFDDVSLIQALDGANKHSGKYNYHKFGRAGLDTAIQGLKEHFKFLNDKVC